MGQRSSKTAPEHIQHEEDRHSAWGSDIDKSLCGPGTLCEDDWTPMNSLPPTPESHRRRFSNFNVTKEVITQQPRIFENDVFSDDNITNFDVMTIHEIDDFAPVMVAPVVAPVLRRRKKRKIGERRAKIGKGTRKMKKMRRKSLRNHHLTGKELGTYNKPHQIRHVQNNRLRRHHIIHVRRIRIHQDPRYPKIPPPSTNPNLKFRRGYPVDKHRYSKAVPPSHLKGRPELSARPHFRYRGIPKIIV